MAFTYEDTLSSNYKLKDLTLTSQPLSLPNLPTAQWQMDNLTFLADMLEQLDYYIGPFNVISGFRTKELQTKLASQGEPTGSGTMSFHEAGRAVDIFPSSMSIAEYFGQILASPLKDQFAEIAIKPAQNALHLAINVPGDERVPKITALNDNKVYAALSMDEIAAYAEPYLEAAAAAAKKIPLSILFGLAAFGGLLLLLRKKPRTA